MEYTVVEETSLKRLVEEVNKLMKLGWKLSGSLVIESFAVVKEDPNEDEIKNAYIQPMYR